MKKQDSHNHQRAPRRRTKSPGCLFMPCLQWARLVCGHTLDTTGVNLQMTVCLSATGAISRRNVHIEWVLKALMTGSVLHIMLCYWWWDKALLHDSTAAATLVEGNSQNNTSPVWNHTIYNTVHNIYPAAFYLSVKYICAPYTALKNSNSGTVVKWYPCATLKLSAMINKCLNCVWNLSLLLLRIE